MKSGTSMLPMCAAALALLLGMGPSVAAAGTRALPFGIGTPGGRGGKVLRVTNLQSEGPGSLRAALATRGPRIVVFEVGGVIDMGCERLVVSEPYLTLAGQTAPSPGITVIKVRGGLSIRTHDVIVQHIAVRPGDMGKPKRSGWSSDAINAVAQGPAEGQVYNIVVDHCSGTWATDENMSVSGPGNCQDDRTTHDVTFSNCIIAEGLLNSTHKKGRHSRGFLVMDGCSRIALIGNLFAHNNERHPLLKGGSSAVVVNNLMVNPGGRCISMTDGGHRKRLGKPRVSIVGNVMVPGRNTRTRFMEGRGAAYVRDNVILKSGGGMQQIAARGEQRRMWPEGLRALPSEQVREHVLKNAGSRPADRDAVDRRIARQCREGKGRIIDSQDDVGGYPGYRATRRKLDIPRENVEKWLRKMADEVEQGEKAEKSG
jgi:pectate lyase